MRFSEQVITQHPIGIGIEHALSRRLGGIDVLARHVDLEQHLERFGILDIGLDQRLQMLLRRVGIADARQHLRQLETGVRSSGASCTACCN